MRATVGRIVHYRSKTGNYTLPAMITATHETLWPEGVALGEVPALSSEAHVHLQVFTPGIAESYPEHDVPFYPGPRSDVGHFAAAIAGVSPPDGPPEQPAGSWRWPERV